MLKASLDEHDSVSRSALDFWSAYAEQPAEAGDGIFSPLYADSGGAPFLARLVNALLRKMQ